MKVTTLCLALALLVSTIGAMYAQSDRHASGSVLPISVGGNSTKDVLTLNVTPTSNDGSTIYRLTVKDVPVDGFWDVTVYESDGRVPRSTQNSITARKARDGSVVIQFGGCNRVIRNCLPTMPGWNYVVRLYQPRPEVIDGEWTFPEAQAVR